MEGGAFIAGALLVAGLVIIGIQVWYTLSLKTDGEIGGSRLLVLLLISFLSLLVVIAPVLGERSIPGILILVALCLPIVSLKISQLWEERRGLRLDSAQVREEIGAWEDTVGKDPEHTGAYIRLGELHLKLGEKDKALEHYRKALLLRPGDPGIKD